MQIRDRRILHVSTQRDWSPLSTFARNLLTPWYVTSVPGCRMRLKELQDCTHARAFFCAITLQRLVEEKFRLPISEDTKMSPRCYSAKTSTPHTDGGGTPSCHHGNSRALPQKHKFVTSEPCKAGCATSIRIYNWSWLSTSRLTLRFIHIRPRKLESQATVQEYGQRSGAYERMIVEDVFAQ